MTQQTYLLNHYTIFHYHDFLRNEMSEQRYSMDQITSPYHKIFDQTQLK